MADKICKQCGEAKPVEQFPKQRAVCKQCINKAAREKMKKRQKHTPAELKKMLIKRRGNRCAKCGYDKFASVLKLYSAEDDIDGLLRRYSYGQTKEQTQRVKEKAENWEVLCPTCREEVRQGLI